jgi:plasmid stabilization system protein ParE
VAYRVRITESALHDVEGYLRYIEDVNQAPEAAEEWLRGLIDEIRSLGDHPRRCPVIPEADQLEEELRHHIYHSHRIIFRVDVRDRQVIVLRVYHGSRRKLGIQDIL